ncbi:DUF1616 domain-containing protein [Actinoplanes xinjiangensis]|uniref:Uncharacterized protein DUF1616 n=1 Tax=Actinoplanes xinjiangensis TaxID=512350 RepID=A0A316FTC6_9ACTN|nr:DUF1616 domain-containing protein [Actinoplanes xinjiangensis]PWK52011.1 uncharacterized protein DUF1616 [Actinoplanes xinjiangensis]GIF37289.1 hypothetical protein Axi01nite_16000 [Actinoplanes xinjiangensis]
MKPVRAGVLAGLTVAASVAVEFGPLPVSLPGGLLLAFVLPGFALNEAIFRPARRDIGVVERTVLVPSLSLAVLVLGGLVLWTTGGHLNRTSWMLVCAVTTLVATGAAYYRTLRAAPAPAGEKSPPVPRNTQDRLIRDVLPLTLAVLLVAGAGVWSYADSVHTYDVPVSTLSAQPPGPVDADGNRAVRMSATGLGAGEWTMVLSDAAGVEVDRREVAPDGAGGWSGEVTVPGDQRVTVNLFRGDEAAAFRTLIISAVP